MGRVLSSEATMVQEVLICFFSLVNSPIHLFLLECMFGKTSLTAAVYASEIFFSICRCGRGKKKNEVEFR